MAADEDCDIQVPVANFRSNHISQKVIDKDFSSAFQDKMSPTAKIGGTRTLLLEPDAVISKDGKSMICHCICGNFRLAGAETCDSCNGKNS